MFISPKTNDCLNLIIQELFYINRIIDRAVSVMNVKFTCVKSSKLIHLYFAHDFPILADKIAEIQDSFNMVTDYLETPADITDYNSLTVIFDRILEHVTKANDLIVNAIETATEEANFNVKVSLENFLANVYIDYIKQAMILKDKAVLYGNDVLNFDRDIKTFFTIGR